MYNTQQQQQHSTNNSSTATDSLNTVIMVAPPPLAPVQQQQQQPTQLLLTLTDDSDDDLLSELRCIICSELFIRAHTLSCAHTFCLHCLDGWMRAKRECPICRQAIQRTAYPTLTIDNVIDSFVARMPAHVATTRHALIEARRDVAARRPPPPNLDQVGVGEEPVEGSVVGEESGGHVNADNPMLLLSVSTDDTDSSMTYDDRNQSVTSNLSSWADDDGINDTYDDGNTTTTTSGAPLTADSYSSHEDYFDDDDDDFVDMSDSGDDVGITETVPFDVCDYAYDGYDYSDESVD